MPHRCCVPACKGNYDSGPKVRVYGFPKDEFLALKWKIAIRRKDLKITSNSKVCELHFQESDFQRVSSMFDEKTGRTVSASLKVPRLIPGSIPSKLPNRPSYLSATPTIKRESPDERRQRLREQAIKAALEKRAKEKAEYDSQRTFTSLEDMYSKLQLLLDGEVWTTIFRNDRVVVMKISSDSAPCVDFSVIIDTQLMVSAFVKRSELSKVGKTVLPVKVTHFDILNDILNHLVNDYRELPYSEDQLQNFVNKIWNDLKEFRETSEHDNNVLKFVEEQLLLFGSNKHGVKYSSDMMTFSRLLLPLAPHAYNFIRKSGNIILPHPNTIHRVCDQFICSPQSEDCGPNYSVTI